MKKNIIVAIISVITIIALIKFIRSPAPLTPSKLSDLESNIESERPETTDNISNNKKLHLYAKAFVEVQSYMDTAGSKVDSRETAKIVNKHGLSVEDYTSIAILMNRNPIFRDKVRKLIGEVEDPIY